MPPRTVGSVPIMKSQRSNGDTLKTGAMNLLTGAVGLVGVGVVAALAFASVGGFSTGTTGNEYDPEVFEVEPEPPAPPADPGYGGPSQGCDIKGNISIDTGEAIYHVPGQEYYDATVIDEAFGERWFCTEEEAVAAGWRRSEV